MVLCVCLGLFLSFFPFLYIYTAQRTFDEALAEAHHAGTLRAPHGRQHHPGHALVEAAPQLAAALRCLFVWDGVSTLSRCTRVSVCTHKN